MKSSKLIPLLTLSFLLSLTFVHYKPSITPRNLIETYQVNEVCNRTSKDILSRYKTHDFTYEPNKNSKTDALVNYLKDNNIKYIIEYLPRVLLFAILIIIAIFSLIGWLCYCCCCCCPSCCCKPNKDNKPGCCGFTTALFLLVFYGIIVVMAVTNIGLSSKLLEGINGASCALFKFYDTVIHGEDEEIQLPRWDGIKKILDKLDETALFINQIEFNSAEGQEAINKIEQDKETVVEYITTLNEQVYKMKQSFTPEDKEYLHDFLNKYTPMTEPNSDLGKIYKEYVQHIEVPFKILNDSQIPFTKIVENTNEFSNLLKDSSGSISDIEGSFNDIADSALNEMYDIQDNINSYGPLIYYLLCGVFCFFGVLGFLGALFYCCCKCTCMRVMLHFTWNFLALLSFVGMIVGSAFGLVGTVGSDAVGVLSFLFGENLQSSEVILLEQGQSTELIDICINGDGRMENKLKLNDMMGPLNQIYNLSKFMNESYGNVHGFDFPELKEVTHKYENYKDTSEWIKERYNKMINDMAARQSICFVFKEDKDQCSGENCEVFEDYIDFPPEKIQNTLSQKPYNEFGSIIMEVYNYMKYANDKLSTKYSDTNLTIRDVHQNMLTIIKDGNGEGNGPIQTNLENELLRRKTITDQLYSIFSSILGDSQNNSTVNIFDIINCGKYIYAYI